MTWAQIGRLWKVPTITAWRAAHGKAPTNPKYRRALGLPPALGVGTQYEAIRYCVIRKCRKPFIPNVPLRRRCFECRPIRRKSHRRKG